MKSLSIATVLLRRRTPPGERGRHDAERALNVAKDAEPGCLASHGNYEEKVIASRSSRPSTRATVKDLKDCVQRLALGGMKAPAPAKAWQSEGTPIVEDGVMYVTDGWGTVYAIDVTSGKKGLSSGAWIQDRQGLGR